jgi:hypothetical protein
VKGAAFGCGDMYAQAQDKETDGKNYGSKLLVHYYTRRVWFIINNSMFNYSVCIITAVQDRHYIILKNLRRQL